MQNNIILTASRLFRLPEQPKCPEDEALQFPERLRDWIFLVMETMVSMTIYECMYI